MSEFWRHQRLQSCWPQLQRKFVHLYMHVWLPHQVFVWEDADEDVVTAYKTYEGHQEDIQCMAAYPRRQLLATGGAGCRGLAAAAMGGFRVCSALLFLHSRGLAAAACSSTAILHALGQRLRRLVSA